MRGTYSPVACGRRKRKASGRPVPVEPVLPRPACDDLRLVAFKLIFLTESSAMSQLRLSRREEWWKEAEILMLCHQLAVALRERSRAPARLAWP